MDRDGAKTADALLGRAERRGTMTTPGRNRTYEPAAIEARLAADNPRWHFADGALRRSYRTHDWRATLMVVNTIGHLAEAAWHHPDLAISYDRVDVALCTHDAKGVTDKDFALARRIEDVVLWRPADGTASGRPAYIEYE
jgi:pterin-4a-carbinolamine dehydratase